MITRLILLGLLFLLVSVASVSSSTGSMSDGYDATDLEVAPISYSAITVPSYEAVAVAIPELNRFSLALGKYNSIQIRETYKYIYVVFSANAMNSPVFGTPPGLQPGLEVQVLKENMKVTGTRRE
jgi:hypothetical protein